MCGTYNGWTNYETWVVKLWMYNSQGAQQYYDDLAIGCKLDVRQLAEVLEQEHDDAAPECTGVFSDLMSSALGAVDWEEIAGSIIDDLEVECCIECGDDVEEGDIYCTDCKDEEG